MLDKLVEKIRKILKKPGNQVKIFVWGWRIALIMAIIGYLIIFYTILNDTSIL